MVAKRVLELLLVSGLSLGMAAENGARLNPTVKVVPNATSGTDCSTGLSPAPMPRLDVSEPPATASVPAPPQNDLRALLAATQGAAAAGDYDSFHADLLSLRALLNDYPKGGERTAAGKVVDTYEDLDQLWQYELNDPEGGFFPASSALAQRLTAYPNFGRTMASHAVIVGDTTVYPSLESRQFLVDQATRLLAPLNVSARPPAPVQVTESVWPARPRAISGGTRRPLHQTERPERPSSGSGHRQTASSSSSSHPAPGAGRHTGSTAAKHHEGRHSSAGSSSSKSGAVSGSSTPGKPPATHVASQSGEGKSSPASTRQGSVHGAPAATTSQAVTPPPATSTAPSARPPATQVAATSSRPPVHQQPPVPSTVSSTAALPTSTTGAPNSSVPGPSSTPPVSDTLATSDTALTTGTAGGTATGTDTASTVAGRTASSGATDTATESHSGTPGRSMALPIILILIGLAVLIVLFRGGGD